jgi:hypothetical protein
MGLRTYLFGEDETESDDKNVYDTSPLYRVTWTKMVEREKETVRIQFVSGKQKRVVYTTKSGPNGQILEDATSDAEPIQVNWDNIEYIDTESTETMEVPVKRRVLVEEVGEKMQELYTDDRVVSETIDYEEA